MPEHDQVSQSTVMRVAVAAAATGAAAYGLQRLRASQDGDEAQAEEPDDQEEAETHERGWSDKREELTQALTSKAAEAKNAAAKLRPGRDKRSTPVGGGWEAASPYVLRAAREAASALGATTADKAPELIRDELIPSFIDGFENGT